MEPHLGSITRDLINHAMTYQAYRELIDKLLAENKTTGQNHSEAYLDYTRMNVQRMNRWDKTAKVSETMREVVEAITEDQIWLVITEAWCGDAAQNIPYIIKLAELNPHIQVRLILRDEHPEVMDEYLTQGTRSIPKVIGMTADLTCELFTWGPRPPSAHEQVMEYKRDSKGLSYKEFSGTLHLWYARNKNQELESELLPLIQSTVIQ
ncbi:thioredoxin-like protein [Algoriphagus aquaeductus]|uniref:Thioredoxin-like protein n=1 Tax=Algoriphagus aquaeductus TaxID=475299 RepID=A0A326RNP5_9BACT|nr:thioredoxin family protein [Algoriphagus aquaeductus]PZV78602.1 thioredoxin-like protein [Algoriphagus aquaeductus]